MIYEITVDCRIANKDYKKWDIVSHEEVWEYFPSVMSPIEASKKSAKAPKVEEPKEEAVEEAVEETAEAPVEEAEEEIEAKPTKKSWKKK